VAAESHFAAAGQDAHGAAGAGAALSVELSVETGGDVLPA